MNEAATQRGLKVVECTIMVDALELGDRYHMKKTPANIEVATTFITNILHLLQAVYEHTPTVTAIDYLVNSGHVLGPTAAIEVTNTATNEVFAAFKRRVIDEYAKKVITSLGASARFTSEEINDQNPVQGEVTEELKAALITQVPITQAEGATVIDVEAIGETEEEESRKRARVDEPPSSSTSTFVAPTPKIATPQVKSAPAPAAPLTSTSSTAPHAEDAAAVPTVGNLATPPVVTEATEMCYQKPACRDLPEHVVKTFAGGTRLALITFENDEEVERPLVPAKGSDYHGYITTLAASLLPKKHILHRISGLLRGHCSDKLRQKFDDNLYVHISDLMHELHELFESQIPMPWSMRVWVAIIANDEKSRFSTLAVRGLPNAEAVGIHLCPIKIRAAQGHQAKLLEGRNPDTLARLVYCNEEHRQFYDESLVQHGNRQMPKRIFHRTYPQAVESIIKYGLIPGGRGLSESGRKHLFFSPLRVNETGYVSGVRADAPVEIAVDIGKAVEAGVDFILTDSDAILTANHIPNDTLLWVINDKEGKTIWTPPSVQAEATATPSSEPTSSQEARPTTEPPAPSNVVPVGVAIKIEDDNAATVDGTARDQAFTAAGNTADPRYPVMSGYFVQVRTYPCPRCQFELVDGMLSCGQCSYIIHQQRASTRDSVIRNKRAEFLSTLAAKRGLAVTDQKLLETYQGRDIVQRGTQSPVAQIIRRAKDRRDNANRSGFWNVLHRFKTDNTYAAILTATGRTEQDVAEIDLAATLHLPHRARTSSQRVVGQGPFSRMSHKERLNLAQLTFCDEGVTRIDPVFAEKMCYYPWMVFWHQKMLFVRQFAIAVQKAGLTEVSVVTFSNENDGVMTFETDKSVDVVVENMYNMFAEGRRAAEQQLDHSRTQSANAPGRNSEWRQIKERDPPLEAFLSTAAPAGDPNSLLRANATMRPPADHDQIIAVPRTPPKAAPSVDPQPTMPVVPKTPPKAAPAPKTPPTPPPYLGGRIALTMRLLELGLNLLLSTAIGDGDGIIRMAVCGGRTMTTT